MQSNDLLVKSLTTPFFELMSKSFVASELTYSSSRFIKPFQELKTQIGVVHVSCTSNFGRNLSPRVTKLQKRPLIFITAGVKRDSLGTLSSRQPTFKAPHFIQAAPRLLESKCVRTAIALKVFTQVQSSRVCRQKQPHRDVMFVKN
jgi:hypothetical protein